MNAPRTLVGALVAAVALAVVATATPSAVAQDERSSFTRTAQPTPSDADVVYFDHDGPDADARYARVRKWPGRTITYFDASLDKQAVKKAVKLWNRSGVDMTFKKIKSKKKAQLVIRNSKNVPRGCGTGLATLGYTGRYQAFVNILHGPDSAGQTCAWPGQTLVVAHELGHVLGLQHDDSRCSLMNTYHVNGVAQGQCVDGDPYGFPSPGHWNCRVLQKVDLKRAERMYGGRIKVNETEWCDLGVKMPASGALAVTQGTYADGVTPASGLAKITINHAAEPVQEAWLDVNAAGSAFSVSWTPGACGAPLGAPVAEGPYNWEVPVGADDVFQRSVTPGLWCFTLQAYDTLGRPAAVPSQVAVPIA